MQEPSHQLRCVGCGVAIPPDTVEKDFRCVDCGQLLEVEYPSWSAVRGSVPDLRGMPNPGALRWLWRERLQSKLPIDRSGVWRFREVLPILLNPENAVTLREGNTPLYRLLQCGEALSAVLLECTMAGLGTCPLTHVMELDECRDIVRGLLDGPGQPQVLVKNVEMALGDLASAVAITASMRGDNPGS